jgi:hypothetical protein
METAMIAFATFDSETLDLLQVAIDGVWQNLPPDRRTSQIKERMAGAAMRLANKGVRDPARLAATTLAAAFSRPSDACDIEANRRPDALPISIGIAAARLFRSA